MTNKKSSTGAILDQYMLEEKNALGPMSGTRICEALAEQSWSHPQVAHSGAPFIMTYLSPKAVAQIFSALENELLWGSQTETELGMLLRKIHRAYAAYHNAGMEITEDVDKYLKELNL